MIEFHSEKMYNIEEAAKKANCSTRTLRRAMKSGNLQGQMIGNAWFFSEESIEIYMWRKANE